MNFADYLVEGVHFGLQMVDVYVRGFIVALYRYRSVKLGEEILLIFASCSSMMVLSLLNILLSIPGR